jgi:lipopolysaccharide/colanic/teichoic acid biosynthesis glycosyltransferase
MLIASAPVILACGVAIAVTSPGPVFFVQERPGYLGTRLRVRKLRTMRTGADRDPRNQFAVTSSHPEVTPLGRVLRALKLDELPQLWSVVKGEMALVGPRPIGDALDQHLRSTLPGFHLRYQVKPGLTSLGQVCLDDNFAPERLHEDWAFRSACELHYVRHRSTSYDLVILFLTVALILRKVLSTRVRPLPAEASEGVVSTPPLSPTPREDRKKWTMRPLLVAFRGVVTSQRPVTAHGSREEA